MRGLGYSHLKVEVSRAGGQGQLTPFSRGLPASRRLRPRGAPSCARHCSGSPRAGPAQLCCTDEETEAQRGNGGAWGLQLGVGQEASQAGCQVPAPPHCPGLRHARAGSPRAGTLDLSLLQPRRRGHLHPRALSQGCTTHSVDRSHHAFSPSSKGFLISAFLSSSIYCITSNT